MLYWPGEHFGGVPDMYDVSKGWTVQQLTISLTWAGCFRLPFGVFVFSGTPTHIISRSTNAKGLGDEVRGGST